MIPDIETLLIIQDRDQKIRELEKDLAQNMPSLIANANARLDGDTETVANLKAENQANEMKMKTLELDIATRRDTILKLKHQQYETKKNEEYQALGNEVKRYEEEVSDREDKELDLMQVGEDLGEKFEAAKAGLARTQVLVDEELAQLEERRKNSENQITELRAEREAQTGKMDPVVLSTYERLSKKKNDPVASLESGQCKGCHMKVTSGTIQKTKAEKEVTNCDNCGRILYPIDY
ncbi:MAG: putative nucleic acid-binding Zn-ribbon protein [Verrucomicrobiales bacterium]|jgi:predicted  nucleic acid-binding Zn-ribbon protein